MTDVLAEPSYFLADPQVKQFIVDQRQDLNAPNIPITATGHFVVAALEPPRGQVMIVKSIVPYAMMRTAVGTPAESMAMLDPVTANGFFSFEPTVNGAAPFVVEQDFNAPQIAAFNNKNRQRSPGISYISQHPWADAQRSWFNPLFSILVPGDAVFQIVFSILPPAIVSPLPIAGQFMVGGAGGARRVDFAGCLVVGQQMSEQFYHGLEQKYGIIERSHHGAKV